MEKEVITVYFQGWILYLRVLQQMNVCQIYVLLIICVYELNLMLCMLSVKGDSLLQAVIVLN